MPSFIDENGNYRYVRSGYTLSNTHGAGHSELHLREIEEICNRIVDEKIKQAMSDIERALPAAIEEYGRQVWERLLNSLDSVLKTDIHSQVSVGVEGIKDIFYGEKCQEYITNSVYKQLKNELNKIKGITVK